jgi:hypothetical protein
VSRSASRGAKAAHLARIAVAALVLVAALFGILASYDSATSVSRAVAALQFFPAADRAAGAIFFGLGSGAIVACLATGATLACTTIFGRWYCAALCPLGTLQDLASLLGKKKRTYRRPLNSLRIAAFATVIALSLLGATSLASWLDPWALFSRFTTYDLQSAVRFARGEDMPGLALLAAVASGAAVAAILGASFLSGRWFCGKLCPVGSVLGGINSVALMRIRLESESCVSCGFCASKCRASCIDAQAKHLDSTRCVNCLACLSACPTGAIRYGMRKGGKTEALARQTPSDSSVSIGGRKQRSAGTSMTRAQFLRSAGGGITAVALLTAPRAFAAQPAASESHNAQVPVLPPGARSIDRFLGACIACGLCVSRCPSKVLQPSFGQLGLKGFMAPRLDHAVSYCQYDCTACMDVCPSGALERMGVERKRLAKIGDATLVKARCVVFTNKTKCGACAEHCPTGAVRMVVGETGLPEPVFSSSICIGCGACHHACPVRPERAISVSGIAVQAVAKKPSPTLFDASPQSGSGQAQASGATADAADDAFPF